MSLQLIGGNASREGRSSTALGRCHRLNGIGGSNRHLPSAGLRAVAETHDRIRLPNGRRARFPTLTQRPGDDDPNQADRRPAHRSAKAVPAPDDGSVWVAAVHPDWSTPRVAPGTAPIKPEMSWRAPDDRPWGGALARVAQRNRDRDRDRDRAVGAHGRVPWKARRIAP